MHKKNKKSDIWMMVFPVIAVMVIIIGLIVCLAMIGVHGDSEPYEQYLEEMESAGIPPNGYW